MKTEGEPNGEQWQRKNHLSACITDKKRMYAIYTNELKRFLKSLTYTWTHELNERKQLFSKDQHLLHRHLTYNFRHLCVIFFVRIPCTPTVCIHMAVGLILFSFFHLLLNMLPYEYFILCLLRFSCALTIKIMPKTERDRIRGETEIRITTRKNQPNMKCAIFYALYRSICNESLSETNKELQWSWIKKNLHG